MAVSNGTGQGGKSMQDRELAARVRTLTLTEIEKVLKNPKNKLYGPVLIKLAGTVLPRLNEHTGADGKELPVPIFNVQSNNSDEKDSGA
jgi:hypothetical protein